MTTTLRVRAKPRRSAALAPGGAIVRQPRAARLHHDQRTHDLLRALYEGATIAAEPGALEPITERELMWRTATGELYLDWDHGRRIWKRV